ncbi:MAG: urease accessory protein [Chthoniobacter sp.]|jgi:urease accessory protein|nr:urease accessory protein [Chthoniobacter sp.]
MGTDWLTFVLQTSDPLFPTGAYAHSLGLEEMVRLGVVRDEETLRTFLQSQIIPALAHHELPYLRFARAAAEAGDVEELCAIDREISAWKISRELREASAQLGARRLKILLQLAPAAAASAFALRVEAGDARGHHLVVCGLQFVKTPLEAALAAYFYQTLAAFCAASLKLVRIGQEACQRVLGVCLTGCEERIQESLKVERNRAGWFNPLLEIASMRHAQADERLFIS